MDASLAELYVLRRMRIGPYPRPISSRLRGCDPGQVADVAHDDVDVDIPVAARADQDVVDA
eukprot:4133043-Pyramimonas_sp.AAC.1